tara:strand:- start:549 stop:1112 length:564 start_codon:yes stop_codon:yes gene_type:complete
MIKIILLLLLFDINKDPAVVDTFDMIEINHYHNGWGCEQWSQLICWDRSSYDNKYHVSYWTMLRDAYEKTEKGEADWEKIRQKIAKEYKDFNQKMSWLSNSNYKGDFIGGKLFPRKDWKSGYYNIKYIQGGIPRVIRSKSFRQTYTQTDPEVDDREIYNQDIRRGLTKVGTKTPTSWLGFLRGLQSR